MIEKNNYEWVLIYFSLKKKKRLNIIYEKGKIGKICTYSD